MGTDRNELARIDRRLLAELDGDGGVQMVKVPVSDAVWSVRRRYCDAVGVTMGEGVAALIEAELATVIGEDTDRGVPVFADRAVKRVVEVTERLEERERQLAACRQRVAERDRDVRDLRRRLHEANRGPHQPVANIEGRTGRNERCSADQASSTNTVTVYRVGTTWIPDNGLLVQTAGSVRLVGA